MCRALAYYKILCYYRNNVLRRDKKGDVMVGVKSHGQARSIPQSSGTGVHEALTKIKRDNYFGEDFEKELAEHAKREEGLSPNRELAMRSLYVTLAIASECLGTA